VCSLQKRFAGQPLALGLERNHGPLVFAVRTSHVRGRVPGNPLPLARYRQACTPSRATADPSAAERPRDWLRTHRDTLPPLNPQRPTLRALAPRVAHRRRVVGDHVRLTTRLPRTRNNSCPQARPWLPDNDPVSCGDVRRHWPTLTAAPLARRSPRETFCREHQVRAAAVMAPRIHAITAAIPLTPDERRITPHGRLGQARVRQLRATWPALQDVDNAITPQAQRHPACPWCQTRPGAGPVVAPRLRVAFGAPRAR